MADEQSTQAEEALDEKVAPEPARRKIIRTRRVGRPLYRRRQTMIVVRPINFGGKTIEVGTVMEPGEYRQHHVKRWYDQRRIGPKDHPWTELVLEDQEGFPKAVVIEHETDPEVKADDEQEDVTEDAHGSDTEVDGDENEAPTGDEDQVDLDEPEDEDGEDDEDPLDA